MSVCITSKAVELYNEDDELVLWEEHHTTSRKSAAFYLSTVCDVYGIKDPNVNAQILSIIRGE